MTNIFRRYVVIWITAIATVLVLGFIGWKYVGFHKQLIKQQSEQLIEFSRRSVSRLQVDFNTKHSENIAFGNDKMQINSSYKILRDKIPQLPKTSSKLENDKVNVIFEGVNGLFSVASITLVYPTKFNEQLLFSVFRFHPELNAPAIEMRLAQSLQPVVFSSAFVIALLFFAQAIYTFRTDRNLNKLADWAQGLTLNKQPSAPPQMQEKGLNPLATMLNNSLQTFNKVLEKEHSFARFTSHELRTQVAILSANMEMLDAIMADLKPSERKVLSRMEQVVSDMKYQTEALLWVSKEIEHELEYETCALLSMVKKSVADNQYLLERKPVSIEVLGNERNVSSHATLLQIVLNNLIRNAAQNTYQGKIVVNVDSNHLSIVNQDLVEHEESESNQGFGIGLVMVEKIAKRLNMEYQVEVLSNGRWVKLFV